MPNQADAAGNSTDNITKLRPDIRCVKIRRFAEAFWVRVEGETYGTVYGYVDNNLVTNRLKYGDWICFQQEEILEEMTK